MKNKIKWLDCEYFRPDETVQPVLVDDFLLYTLFDPHGYSYVFETIRNFIDYMEYGKDCGNIARFNTVKQLEKFVEGYDPDLSLMQNYNKYNKKKKAT